MRQSVFPTAFQCYKPRHHRIYGSICVSPENTILLVKGRRSGKWSFPKGHLESEETSLDCAIRELYEETGMAINTTPVGSYKLSVGQYYLFETNETELAVRDHDEIEEAAWIPFHKLSSMNCNVDVNNFLMRLNGKRYR
jgi:bis(5'-nucleosidyl)-tetraphosphatase